MLKALFALLLALGGGVLAIGADLHREDRAAAAWLPVPAEVIDIEVRSPSDGLHGNAQSPNADPPSAHYPVIRYRWEVDGQPYASTRFRLGESLPAQASREAALRAAAAYQVGQRITAYRHPGEPERAVLDRGAPIRAWLAIGVGLVMLLLGAIGLMKAVQVARALES